MAAGAQHQSSAAIFDPSAIESFRFEGRRLAGDGTVELDYALGGELQFTERVTLPVAAPLSEEQIQGAQGLLALLHWTAGVSYFKAALPARIACESPPPGSAAAALLEALYSEGLGELAYRNELKELPRPRFPRAEGSSAGASSAPPAEPRRILVPVGGGKDSAVALEIVRRSGAETALFSIGDAPPIMRTAGVAGLPHLIARRTLDPLLFELNAAGAINGHVPVTAIVTCVALLTARLNGFDAVAMANERSASAGNLRWDGIDVNHQFSKGLVAERLLSAAVAEQGAAVRQFSVLRPASELAIARAFAGLESYHGAFTSCNAIFRIDPALRASSWCRDCPKCRFVFLAMAPFSSPAHLSEIFGADLLDEEDQYEGFALLAASGGHKPFECVGEEQESVAAMRLLAADERWREHAVVRRLTAEVLPSHPLPEGDPETVLALSDDHDVPDRLMAEVRALLRA
jgi:UDP-N-acetyl-alpha-D-muramoyl-L-alanyl-L-glutamate epimerase